MAKKEKEKNAIQTPTDEKSKLEVLKATMEKLEKTYGKGAVMKLSDEKVVDVEVISTGSLSVDLALGVGGFPRGRIIEIFGPESSGKTTLAIHTIIECQKAGGIAAFIDAEHAFDRFYAEKLGMDPEKVIISQPDSGEQALEIAEQLIRSGAIDIVVIDSVAALVPKAEIDGDMGDSKMGLQARLMSQAMRKLTSVISKTNCCCIFINQLREKIGNVYGNPETTTGGNALKYYASVRVDIRKVTTLKDKDDNAYGNRTRVKIVKNKVAPPFKQVEFEILFGKGINKVGEIADLATELNVLKKSGANYYYNETKLALGREKLLGVLEENPELLEELKQKVKEKIAAGAKIGEISSEEKAKVRQEEQEAEQEVQELENEE
ncbi:MAG: recombinase RecA [Raineya sp.]|nr:recombinase RecA [Raineya sp.]MDW8296182.1 recombinase RecA [Raineya sp.]